MWEKEKMLVTNIFSFSHNVFYISQANFSFCSTFILSSANAFNFGLSKILWFGKGLMYLQKDIDSCQPVQCRQTDIGQNVRLGQTGKWICYGGKTDKKWKIWLSGDKIQLPWCLPHNDRTSNLRLCPFSLVESFEHAQNFKPDETDITGRRRTWSGFTR